LAGVPLYASLEDPLISYIYIVRKTKFYSEKMKIDFGLLRSEGLADMKISARQFLV
jgi:hypothetical protein